MDGQLQEHKGLLEWRGDQQSAWASGLLLMCAVKTASDEDWKICYVFSTCYFVEFQRGAFTEGYMQ